MVRGVEYCLFHRELQDVIGALLRRLGSELQLPELIDPAHTPISELWHGSEYQKVLREFRASWEHPDDHVLVPLELFSGAQTLCGALYDLFRLRLFYFNILLTPLSCRRQTRPTSPRSTQRPTKRPLTHCSCPWG